MPLNLLSDPWIPVRSTTGPRTISPDQIAETGVQRLDWPRADLNLACLELLIGLVFMAAPPEDKADWRAARPDPERLRAALVPFIPAFNLDGDGPRFLQDSEPLLGDPNPLDMLFIDSAGGNTAKNNADLMVRRARYPALSLPIAAMALYTMQAFAPSGGAGNRTSMRGGGPMVTLAEPAIPTDTPLWSLIWANVPLGHALDPAKMADALPWVRPTRTSEKGSKTPLVAPPEEEGVPVETFFGMPRRLRLNFDEGRCAVTGEAGPVATGVVQRPYGTNYTAWPHPLTPFYRQKAGGELLPVHPKARDFSYRDWRGVSVATGDGLREKAKTVARAMDVGGSWRLHVAGWAMDNMKPEDFIWSEQPLLTLTPDQEIDVAGLIEAADIWGRTLAMALQSALEVQAMDAAALDAERERYFVQTQSAFEAHARRIEQGERIESGVGESWRMALRSAALNIFEARVFDDEAWRDLDRMHRATEAQGRLNAAFAGYGPKMGQAAFNALSLPLPDKKRKVA